MSIREKNYNILQNILTRHTKIKNLLHNPRFPIKSNNRCKSKSTYLKDFIKPSIRKLCLF